MEGTHRTRGKGKEKYGSLVRLEKITKQRSLQREYCNSIWIIMEGKREEKGKGKTGREEGNKRKEREEGKRGGRAKERRRREERKEIRGKREEGRGEEEGIRGKGEGRGREEERKRKRKKER